MKMQRRSLDERLRTAADCMNRLRGLRPDPRSMPHARHYIGDKFEPLVYRRAWSGLRARWRWVSAAFRNRLCGRRHTPFIRIIFYLRIKRV